MHKLIRIAALRSAHVTALIVGSLLLTSCAGYQLGSMLPPDIETVFVPTFVNDTEEPLLEVETTRRAISYIQRDGSLRIASENTADSILLVTLTDFEIAAIAYDRTRRAAAEEYRMFIRASVQLVRRTTGTVIAEDPRVVGESTFLLVGDLTSAKLTGIPDAAEDLAQRIVSAIVEAWL